MVTIRLLGPPSLERAGQPIRAPRGRKAWAVLGYLLLTERPTSRRQLAELFFADAEDPLGALRWTLAELRRSLGLADALVGDPVVIGHELDVDVHRLFDAAAELDVLTAVTGELLEGADLLSAPEFESWLLVERHRVSGAIEARLRQEAVALLATGRPDEAVAFAARAVATNPLEEGNHELLVRALAMTGDRDAALAQVVAFEDLIRAELDVEPSPTLREAATAGLGSPGGMALSGRAAAASQLEAGRAAISAGAVDAGVQCLRTAVAEAERSGDGALQGQALAALGGALVHAVRGRDEEGSVVLLEAIELAERSGDRSTAVLAHRELGFVEVQAGRRQTGETWLTKAEERAETDEEFAAILGVRGMNASDQGDYAAAFELLGRSVDRAASSADRRQQAWSMSLIGRAHVLRGDRAEAIDVLDRTLQVVQDQRWVAFLPWPQAFRAELDLRDGDVEGAAENLEHAWALACQLGDPCWEGVAARGLGLVHVERGDRSGASSWFTEAASRSNRVTDRYQWVRAYVLDSMVQTALDHDDVDTARPLAMTLATLAARCDMREFVVRSELHRHRLGDQEALGCARLLADELDSPALTELMSMHSAS